jgi:hypothetical protein
MEKAPEKQRLVFLYRCWPQAAKEECFQSMMIKENPVSSGNTLHDE